MATKKRPRAAKAALARRRGQQRRRSSSKRYVGGTAAQSVRVREAERQRVARRAEGAGTEKPGAEAGMPLGVTFVALIEDTLRLLGTLALAPFRLAVALRRLTAAPGEGQG